MKNFFILALVIGVVVLGYVAASSKLRMSMASFEGKTVAIKRGDLTLPINATGEIKPARRVEIKSEASGEVIEIARQAGERVEAGDLIIRLQPDDEQRNVDRARQDLEIAEAKLEESKLRLQQAKTADLQTAEARVAELAEQLRLAIYRKDKLAALPEHQRNDEEMLQRSTGYESAKAQLAAGKANLEVARIAVPRLEQAVIQAEASKTTAETILGDAQKRLSKTDIVAPIPGVVADIKAQIGDVIQGGKTTLTGGTVLAILLDMDKLVVRAEVDEADIGRVLRIAPSWAQPGRDPSIRPPDDWKGAVEADEHPPVITVESFRNEEFLGVIERVYPEPVVINNVVTYPTDVVIAGENRSKLLPRMRADVRFTSEHVEGALLCPNEAIRVGEGGDYGVFKKVEAATPDESPTKFVACKFGLSDGNQSEVLSGLSEGDEVYVKLPIEREKDRG
jgi:HlyD family secretion protein/macrolide-specific efflux system membrane fusion protein